MKKLFIILISGLFLVSCESISGEKLKVTEGPENTKVEKLFTVDGVTVYRFYDCGDRIYFTNSTGIVRYETDDNEGSVVTYRTLCNGKIE